MPAALVTIDDLRPPRPPRRGLSLWTLGLRPFYLLAAGWAALAVPLWLLQWLGWLPAGALPGAAGHAHEMLLGFVLAVLTGFLFTAARNWTGLALPVGTPLVALALLWLAARALAFTPWAWAAAAANALFALLVATALLRVLLRARNHRNLFLPALVLALGAASVVMHGAAAGIWPGPPQAVLPLALDALALLLAVMGGRVVPGFTNSALPQRPSRLQPWVERLAAPAVLAVAAGDAIAWAGLLPALAATSLQVLLLAGCAGLHGWRWWLWRPWTTRGQPLLWVLHLGYAWLVLHFALRALVLAAGLPASAAWHALTTGALGLLAIGMMSRTARGHTGHPLLADRWDVASYVAVALAAVVRVLPPLAWPAATLPAVASSAFLWSAGFAVYLLRYAPRLARPRRDGRPD